MPISQSKINSAKKPACEGWDKYDIIASLWRRGTSLQRLSREHGYCRSAMARALQHPWPRAERIIAEALGVPPQQIWPSRYHPDGRPKSGRGERGLGDPRTARRRAARLAASQRNTRSPRVNVHARRAT
jgi:Ner family transcriptional regulator